MQPPDDVYVSRVTFRPYALCIFAESFLAWWKVSADAKTPGNWGKNRDLLYDVAFLEVRHANFYTRWIHTVVCMMTLLTDKAAQVTNQWGNCLKFMVTHRVYKNHKGIWKHIDFCGYIRSGEAICDKMTLCNNNDQAWFSDTGWVFNTTPGVQQMLMHSKKHVWYL